MAVVTDEQVAAYLPKIKSQARRFSGWNGAELEDLIQEGMIAVWLSLEDDTEPTQSYIDSRMKNWTRLVRGNWTYEEVWENGLHHEGS